MLGTCSSNSRFRLARAAATATQMERTRGNDAQWLVRNENVYQNKALTIPHYYPPADEMNMMLDVSLELSLFV